MRRLMATLVAVLVALTLISMTAGAAVKIRVASWGTGEELQPIADKWNSQRSDIEMVIEGTISGDYGDRLMSQIAAGTAPDVFMVGDGDVLKWAEAGYIMDMTTLIEATPGFMDQFAEGSQKQGNVRGHQFALTKDYSNLAVYYNRALFDEAGVPYPEPGWTWDDFLDAAKRLTKVEGGKTVQYGVLLSGSWIRAIEPWVYQAGGDFFSPDGQKASGYLNSPETVKAIQFYMDLYFKHKVAPTPAEESANGGASAMFANEMVAMRTHGMWNVQGLKDAGMIDLATAPLPVGAQAANSICWAGFCMYSKTPNPKEAWEVMQFLAGPEGQRVLAAHALPSVESVIEEFGMTEDPAYAGFLQDLPNVKSIGNNRIPQEVFGVIEGILQKDVLDAMFEAGGGNVQELLNAAAEKADAGMAAAWKAWRETYGEF